MIAPARSVRRNSASVRFVGSTGAKLDPAANAAALVVVTTISRVLLVIPGNRSDEAGVQPMHRVHTSEHAGGHTVGHAADRNRQSGDGVGSQRTTVGRPNRRPPPLHRQTRRWPPALGHQPTHIDWYRRGTTSVPISTKLTIDSHQVDGVATGAPLAASSGSRIAPIRKQTAPRQVPRLTSAMLAGCPDVR